jgi:hypothetical protein
MEIQQLLMNAGVRALTLLGDHADNLTAAFVLFLGYRLMKIGIQREAPSGGALVMPEYLARLAPGAAFSLVGVVVMLDRSPLSLLLYLLTATLVVGFAFAFLGYRLFSRGVLGDSDLEAVWNDRRLLLKRAAPGSLFALFGLVMIAFALWQGPSIVRDYQNARLQVDQQLTSALDKHATELVNVFKEYLSLQGSQPAVESASSTVP